MQQFFAKMNSNKVHRIAAGFVFTVSFITYLLTTYPSLSFWDCGEFIATSYTLSVPHSPGAPLFELYMKVFSLIPYAQNIAHRMNIISCLASAFTVMFLYLIAVRLIKKIRSGHVESIVDQSIVYGSSIIGALVLTWSDTFWFNAIESEVYASSMFFLSIIIWLALVWYEKADDKHSERYLILIAYLIGLSIGVHQLSLLAYFGVALIIYFRKFVFSFKSLFLFGLTSIGLFFIIYPVIILWLPNLLDGKIAETDTPSVFVQLIPLLFVIAAIVAIYYSYKKKNAFLNVASISALLILLGFSTYTEVLIRANKHTPINEGDPNTLERMVQYLNREQYGDTPILRGATFDNLTGNVNTDPDKKVWFPRRWSREERHIVNYKKYQGDGDFFLKYQINQMFLRYFFWNFIGKAGDNQDAPAYVIGEVAGGPENGKWSVLSHAFPNVYYGIPFILGLIGIIYHFKKDWKMGLAFLALFTVLGVVLAFYFNMFQPQPRERDYFFVGAFLIFSVWISIGSVGVAEFFEKRFQKSKLIPLFVVIILCIVAPVNMAKENWFVHNHSKDWIPWDLSYNTLQSCEKDAILFTHGDNDTFPLWYLQVVEGVRRDIRIVCLSLLNTEWYSRQLKNEEPFGALKVPISYSDEDITRLSVLNDETIVKTAWREEKKQIVVPVPGAIMTQFRKQNSEGTADYEKLVNITASDTVMKWTSKSRFPVRDSNGSVLYVRQWQDIMIEDIVKTNRWKRPIYFSVTCAPEAFIGMDSYLRMDGIALRVTPIEGSQNTYVHVPSLKENLFNRPNSLAQTPQHGFTYRGLNDPNCYFDENVQRLMSNYRNAYLRLALYYLQVAKDKKSVVLTLDKMFEVLPQNVVPLDYRLQYDVATIYLEAGAVDKYQALASEIEKRCWAEVQRNPYDVQSFYSPYRFLLEMYQQDKKFDKAASVLDTILKYHPGLEDVKAKRDELRSMIPNKQ